MTALCFASNIFPPVKRLTCKKETIKKIIYLHDKIACYENSELHCFFWLKLIFFQNTFRRFPENKRLDVMTRKTYALRTGAKISIEKDRKSGAKMEEDGELHVVVRGASGLNYPSSMG